eukprot:COSAG03_NODE_16894_length_389_cov_0.886207_1_plen_20_part_10
MSFRWPVVRWSSRWMQAVRH